eukprot:499763-Amphidinium_carterae.1
MCNETFYHWTSIESARKIIDSKEIWMSEKSRGDAAYGRGTYLTKYGPDMRSKAIRDLGAQSYEVCFAVPLLVEKCPCMDPPRSKFLLEGESVKLDMNPSWKIVYGGYGRSVY